MDTGRIAAGDRGFRDRHPVVIGSGIALAGAVVVCLLVVGSGLSITEGLISGPIIRWDASVNEWFVTQRTPSLDSIAHLGSMVGMTLAIIAVAAVCVAALAIMRRYWDATFLVVALVIEASVSLLTTLIVARPRPTVPRLEPAPPTSSYPSGHTAAAIALYVGLALLITPHIRQRWLRMTVWAIGIAIPVFVGVSRIYSGMHHVTDIAGSVFVGAGALFTAMVAVRYSERESP